MPYIVTDLGKFTNTASSGGTNLSSGIGGLDDASSISLFLTSSALCSVAAIQVSQFDPYSMDPPPNGWAGSTAWFNLSTAVATVTSSGSQLFINNISFRGLRISVTATSSAKGEVMAFVCKQISV